MLKKDGQDDEWTVSSVMVLTTDDENASVLSNAIVTVNDAACATLPSTILPNTWHTSRCNSPNGLAG